MTKRENFIEEFNALVEKYDVEFVVRERTFAMQSVADGIDIEFDYDSKEGMIKDIVCGCHLREIEKDE